MTRDHALAQPYVIQECEPRTYTNGVDLHSMRRHDWSGFAALGAALASAITFAVGQGTWAIAFIAMATALAVLTRYWSLTYRGPMPHLLRWTLLVPRGNQSPDHLARILLPRAGEHMLEVGPGVGLYSLPIAATLAPGGTLDVFDIQQAMLDDVMRRHGRRVLPTSHRNKAMRRRCRIPIRPLTPDI